MTTKQTLSDKRRGYPMIDEKGEKWYYEEKDVKEFIRNLKEVFSEEDNYKVLKYWIDQFAGEKLT